MKLGCHLSIKGSIDKAVDRAVEKGCNTFQIFTRNPRSWATKILNENIVLNFKTKMRRYKIEPVFIHTSYLLNIASPKDQIYQKSIQILIDELKIASKLGISFVVIHPGSHLGFGKEYGLKRVINALNNVLMEAENNVNILLENTAGTKNSVGSYFKDISKILFGVDDKDKIGICFDTCHAFSAGYNMVSIEMIELIMEKIDNLLGIKKLKLIHLNDSKRELNSGIDRHEHIGMGNIGEKGFRNILKSKMRYLPLILETPIDERRNDVENLLVVKKLYYP